MYESGRCWMPLVPAPTGLPGPAAVSSASSSQPGWSPWLLRYQTPRVPKPARYHELDRLPCPLRRSAGRRAADPRVHYRRRVVGAVLGFLVGVGLLLAGVVVNFILVAVAGFVVMLACSMWAVTSYRRMTGSTTGRAPVKGRGSGKRRHAARGRRPGKQAGSGLMGRLEKRWRRRQQGDR
jgi:hypothetical protein